MFASRMQIFIHIFNVSLCNDTHADGVYTKVLFLSRSEDRALFVDIIILRYRCEMLSVVFERQERWSLR